jgi:hypothetical protein
MIPQHETLNIIDSSKINDFIKCRRYFMYRYLFGWQPMTSSNHLIFGSAWHLAMEHLLTHDYSSKSLNEAYQLFLAEYRKTFAADTDEMFEPKTPDNAFVVLVKYAEKFKHDLELFNVLYTEIAGSVTIGENAQVHFRLDSIIQDKKTGKISSLEHKTGSSTYNWLEQWMLSIQIGTYTHVLNCLFPDRPIEAVFMNCSIFGRGKKAWAELNQTMQTTQKTIPYDFIREPIKKTRDQMQVWLETINYYYDEIQLEKKLIFDENAEHEQTLKCFPLNPLSCLSYGRICEYRDFCTAWANPLKRFNPDEPPLGFRTEFWNPMAQQAKKVVTL